MLIVWHEVGSGIHRRILVQVDQLPSRFERMYIDLGLSFGCRMAWRSGSHGIGGESDFGSIRRNRREQSDGPVRSELLLVGTVVIHGPNLFVASAVRDKVDPGTHEASRAKQFQDVGGKLLRNFPR